MGVIRESTGFFYAATSAADPIGLVNRKHHMYMYRSLAVAALALASLAPPATAAEPKRAQVDLLASVKAVAPGQSFDLAVRFRIDKNWHIYWQNPGDSGMAPSVAWKLPASFTVGPLQFPYPRKHRDEAGLVTYILEDKPLLLATVTAPANLPNGDKLTFAADVKYLVCKELCVQEQAELKLELPFTASPADVKLANEDLFKAARQALPATSSKYVKITAAPDKKPIQPGDEFDLLVKVEIAKDYHIQSDRPLDENLIASELLLERVSGLEFEPPKYPEPLTREMEGIGKVSEFAGALVIRIPAKLDADYDAPTARVGGVLRFQACSSKTGQCYPPENIAWRAELPLGQAVRDSLVRDSGAVPDARVPDAAQTNPPQPAGTADAPADRGETPSHADAGTDEDYQPIGGTWLDRAQQRLAGKGVLGLLLMALMGGFLLNLTPCVLPVVAIKVLSFVRQARESRWRVFQLALAFAGGIIASYVAVGLVIIALESQWGGLFQMPRVIIGFSALVTAFALSLFGVFSFNPPRVVNELGEKAAGEGLGHAFATGLLATALATACAAPFLSFVMAIAVKERGLIALSIFAVAGIGMALPYVALAYNPKWLKVVPKSGPWMVTFERVMGFALLATAVWLLDPLGSQLGAAGLWWAMLFLLFVSCAAWVYGRLEFGAMLRRRLRTYATVAALLIGGWWLCFHTGAPIDELVAQQIALRKGAAPAIAVDWQSTSKIPWQPYSQERVRTAVAAGRTVFVDYTADWCKNCKLLEKLVLNTDAVRRTMQELGVVPFRADYTSPDPEITADLQKYGRAGVPMFVVIPGKRPDKAVVLPEILTVNVLIEALRAACASATARAPIPPARSEATNTKGLPLAPGVEPGTFADTATAAHR